MATDRAATARFRGFPRILRLWVLVAAGSLASGCAVQQKLQPPAPVISSPDAAAPCLADLERRQVDYDRLEDFSTPEGCGIQQAVRIKKLPLPLNRPELLACPTALNLAEFEVQAVIPTAKKLFGRPVVEIISAGTYDCRAQRNDHPERLSEHAHGRAIDITGFVLSDGVRITISKDWSAKDAKAAFLHRIAAEACQWFSAVLTPKTNRLHHDHLHMDNGPYKKCDA